MPRFTAQHMTDLMSDRVPHDYTGIFVINVVMKLQQPVVENEDHGAEGRVVGGGSEDVRPQVLRGAVQNQQVNRTIVRLLRHGCGKTKLHADSTKQIDGSRRSEERRV